MELSLSDIQVHPSSYVDPNGFVFTYEGQICRAIYPEMEPFYRRLITNGTLKYLLDNFYLVSSELTPFTIPQSQCSLVFRHEKIEPLTYCTEWCSSMNKKAALATLELSLALQEKDCILQDAYPWNILFDSVRPVHVDLTSIIPDSKVKLLWPAYQQFLNFFLYPLQLASMGKGHISRLLLRDHIHGITLSEFIRHLNVSYLLRHPCSSMLSLVLGAVEKKSQKQNKIRKKLQSQIKNIRFSENQQKIRRHFFQGLIRKTQAISLPSVKDNWDEYYENIVGAKQDKKIEVIENLLKKLKPDWVLDLGCNVGRFSVIAAQSGARVISMDSSEACVEVLYKKADSENLSITPVIGDILNPTPAFGFLGRQFLPMIERFRSDVVLCLGLMHHLHINGRQSFERIAALMSEITKKALVFEYVDPEDENICLLDHGRKIEYTLNSVSMELLKHFNISIFDSDRPTRRILLCEKK